MANREKSIFISHTSKDKELVDKLVDLLTSGCGVDPNIILCTSLEGKDGRIGRISCIIEEAAGYRFRANNGGYVKSRGGVKGLESSQREFLDSRR